MSQPQETQTDGVSDFKPSIWPIIDSFLQRMTVDQRERLKVGSPDIPTKQLMMDLFLEIIAGLSVDLLKSIRRLKVEMTEEEVNAILGDTVTQALKEAINGDTCSCRCRSAKRLDDLISKEVHQNLQCSSFGRDAGEKPTTPSGRLCKMLQLASKTFACVPRKMKDLFTSESGRRPTPDVKTADSDFEPQEPQNLTGKLCLNEPSTPVEVFIYGGPNAIPEGPSGASPQSPGGISAHELLGMVPTDPEPEALNYPAKRDDPTPPLSDGTDSDSSVEIVIYQGPNYHSDQEDSEVEIVPSPVVKEKMSSFVKDQKLEFLIRTLVAKTLQKCKVDDTADTDVYVELLLQRTRAELEGLDFNLDSKTLRQFNTDIFGDLSEKWGGDFNVLVALKKNDLELGDWVASTLKDRLLAPPGNGSGFRGLLSPVGRASTGGEE
ncbi:uncharacterized protein AB9W97_003392 [Spinachia spinachia]